MEREITVTSRWPLEALKEAITSATAENNSNVLSLTNASIVSSEVVAESESFAPDKQEFTVRIE